MFTNQSWKNFTNEKKEALANQFKLTHSFWQQVVPDEKWGIKYK